MINTLPEFETSQVLTSDELNWLTCYVDSQNRQSRRFLIGCGLIGGLQVKLVGNSIQITNGIGLTSAGHIVSLQKEGASFTTYSNFKIYSQNDKEKLAFHYLSDIDAEAKNYVDSVKDPSIYFQNFKGEVLELFEGIVNNTQPIVANNFLGKVVVIFAEIIQKELKNCEDENCQDHGKKYNFTTKVLVVSQEDAMILLNNEYGIQTTDELAISKLAFPWLHLPNLKLLKPVFSNFSINNAFDENSIIQEYTRCIVDFKNYIFDNLVTIDIALKNLKNYCGDDKLNYQIIDKLNASINKFQSNNNKTVFLCQLFYDYLWTFVKAYQEILIEAQGLKAKVFSKETGFPNHILAGKISNQNVDFEASISSNYNIFRHGFQARFAQTEQAAKSKNVSILLDRLLAIVASYDETAVVLNKEIKVVASGDIFKKLSKQAIPYYLNEQIVPKITSVWSQWASQENINKNTTSYAQINESQTASSKLIYNTLPSAFQGDQSFFRVEAVHGQISLDALNTVFQIRKKHGLAFEVMMLRLNEKAPANASFNFAINEDIESMYQIVRAELLKQINLNLTYLRGLQLKTGKFNVIKGKLTEALKASYNIFLLNLNITDLVAKPIGITFENAKMASNITTSNNASFRSNQPMFETLEMAMVESKSVSNSFLKAQNASISDAKSAFLSTQLFEFNPDFVFGILINDTLGNLIDTIKASADFKDTTEISFYSHLLGVAKSLQKSDSEGVLLYLSLQLYSALKLQALYMSENFLELDIAKYKDNLDNNLLKACNALTVYLKKFNNLPIRSDSILAEIIKGEMLDYSDRIKFDDDWVKINQIDIENKKRNGGLGFENLLEKFLKVHPGVMHGCGVPKGGTYIMVYDQSNRVTADFYLPYIISSTLRPLQYTLLETKTLTISGFVKEKGAAGTPVKATLLVGTSTILTDNQGFYNALVVENTKVKVVVDKAGFDHFETEVDVKNVSLPLNIELTKANITSTTTVIFKDQFNKNVIKDINILNLNKSIVENAPNGKLIVTGKVATANKYSIQDANFEDKEFEILLDVVDKTETLNIVQVAIISIQIKDSSEVGFNKELLASLKITNPSLELDDSNAATGFFETKTAVDISKPATAVVLYNGQSKAQEVKAGDTINEILFDAIAPPIVKNLNTFGLVFYPPTTLGLPPAKIKSIKLNSVAMLIDTQLNFGKTIVPTSGTIKVDKMFVNSPIITIGNMNSIENAVFLINSKLAADGTDIGLNNAMLTFNKAMTDIEIRGLLSLMNDFKLISEKIELKLETFYCLLLAPDQIKRIKTLLNV